MFSYLHIRNRGFQFYFKVLHLLASKNLITYFTKGLILIKIFYAICTNTLLACCYAKCFKQSHHKHTNTNKKKRQSNLFLIKG